MENENTFVGSSCCGKPTFLATVYLWVKRQPPYEGHGRREIAEVICCQQCHRQAGDLRIFKEAPPEFNGSVWAQMQKKTGGDRFYCEWQDGKLVPFGGVTRPAALPASLQRFSPQELAANDK
jgi:hypothetical protein